MRSHLQSNVVAYVALFVALAGSSYAAVKLPANSVGSKQLRARAVTNTKLKARSVSNTKLGTGSVSASKLRRGAVTGAAVKDGSLGGVQVDESSLGQVPDAAKLSGTPASGFLRGAGQAFSVLADPRGSEDSDLFVRAGFPKLRLLCGSDGNTSTLELSSGAGQTATYRVQTVRNGAHVQTFDIGPGDHASFPYDDGMVGHTGFSHALIQMVSGPDVLSLQGVVNDHGDGDKFCNWSLQALETH